MEAIKLEIDEKISPLVNRLNSIFETNIALLADLEKMTNEFNNSPIKDLPSYQKKMEKRMGNIRIAILVNDSFIEDIRLQIDSVLAPFRKSVSTTGSINF
jgi:hypothetical protein